MKIPQWAMWAGCAVVWALILLGVVAAVHNKARAGGYSCDFKLAVMRQAAEDTITELGSQHPQSHYLIQRLSDAQFRCGWDDSRYRCQTRD